MGPKRTNKQQYHGFLSQLSMPETGVILLSDRLHNRMYFCYSCLLGNIWILLLYLQSGGLISYIKKHEVQGHTFILSKKANLNKHKNSSELTHPLKYNSWRTAKLLLMPTEIFLEYAFFTLCSWPVLPVCMRISNFYS